MLQAMSPWEILLLVAATAGATVIAMAIPAMTKLIFSGLIPSESFNLILPVAMLLVFSILSSHMIRIIQSLATGIVNMRAGAALQAAAMGRVLTMPVQFFREYSSGEISERLHAIDRLTNVTLNAVFSTGLTGIFSIAYIFQISAYAPELVVPAIAILVAKTALALTCMVIGAKRNKILMQKESRLSGMTLNILNGIQKIRLTGAENRIFTNWAKNYTEIADLRYQPPKILLYRGAILSFITTVGMAVIYYMAVSSGVTQANYMAFNSAYGMVAGAFSAVVGIAGTFAEFGPLVNMIRPILENEPELEPGKKIPDALSGSIHVGHVTFRYEKDGPAILDDISLDIHPGEYVAIVGSTGCGKSTLMRLMLGFEKPERGAIYYDKYNLNDLNLRGLRRKIGTVLQNGQLLQGSVFSNLSIAKPDLTQQEAWKALELAGLADDIRKMPMKLETMLSENGGGISGGQRQRLLIARALVGNPKIVFMDEATSALDNMAQAHVADALDQLSCTRVVIAHRLSTIQNCDRIIMLEGGKIVEEGTYNSLIEAGGRFAALVERQRL